MTWFIQQLNGMEVKGEAGIDLILLTRKLSPIIYISM